MDDEFKKIVCDRLEGWELVEFLQIPTEDIYETFLGLMEDNVEDIRELVGLRASVDGEDA